MPQRTTCGQSGRGASRTGCARIPLDDVVQVSERLAALRAKSGLGTAELTQSLVEIDAAARRCCRDATRRYLVGLGHEPPEILSAWGQGVESCPVPLAHAHQSLVLAWGAPPQRAGAAFGTGFVSGLSPV